MVYMADQVEETAYLRIIKQITEIEGSVNRRETSTADISDSFGKAPPRTTVTYKALLDRINEIEKKGKPQQKQPTKVQVPHQAVQVQPSQPEQLAAAPVMAPQAVKQEELIQEPAPQKESAQAHARRELAELSKSLPVHIPRFGAHKLKRVNAADLVMPNLSLADQVAELERILEGLNAGALRGDDLETVRSEVYGLVELVNREKKGLKKRPGSLSQDEYQILELRDRRIEDAVSAMERIENAGE